jgi:hypothetical protein
VEEQQRQQQRQQQMKKTGGWSECLVRPMPSVQEYVEAVVQLADSCPDEVCVCAYV